MLGDSEEFVREAGHGGEEVDVNNKSTNSSTSPPAVSKREKGLE
jgi:hypothetical protein